MRHVTAGGGAAVVASFSSALASYGMIAACAMESGTLVASVRSASTARPVRRPPVLVILHPLLATHILTRAPPCRRIHEPATHHADDFSP